MGIPDEHAKEFAGFPAVLRDLVLAEIAAGNEVAEFSHGHPAAPCGAYIRLARAVTTRPRATTESLSFYDRDGSSYSGEFTDATRHFFVLEPPHTPKPPPDMDAIRAELDARYLAANAIRDRPQDPPSAFARFRASMEIDYEKWREGIGYDLAAISQATPEERDAIESMLISRISDWRDVEALAVFDSEKARTALKHAFQNGNAQIRMAIHSRAPDLLSERERTDSLVKALQESENYTGLTEALLEVEDFHPPEIIDALLRGLIERDGGTACHFAAMLYFLHGKAPSAFDWEQRPFFLRFNTDDMTARRAVARELCATLGITADWLQ